MTIIQHPSPNYNSGVIIQPVLIVIHWTAGWFKSSVDWLCNPKAQVSSHYVISKDGAQIYQLVDHNRRAWHCNPSWHPVFGTQDVKGLNSYSVGIECEGPPSLIKYCGWTEDFIDALAELCQHIKNDTPQIIGITDHSTISPQIGKSDVLGGNGIDAFPWVDLVSKSGLKDMATAEHRKAVREHYKL